MGEAEGGLLDGVSDGVKQPLCEDVAHSSTRKCNHGGQVVVPAASSAALVSCGLPCME